jgi:hypothetical protein
MPGTSGAERWLSSLRIVAMTGSRQPVTLHDVLLVGRRTSPDDLEVAISVGVEAWAGRPDTFDGPPMPHRIDSHDAAVWEIPFDLFRERIGRTVTEVRAVGQRYSPPSRLPFVPKLARLEYESDWIPIGPEATTWPRQPDGR